MAAAGFAADLAAAGLRVAHPRLGRGGLFVELEEVLERGEMVQARCLGSVAELGARMMQDLAHDRARQALDLLMEVRRKAMSPHRDLGGPDLFGAAMELRHHRLDL